MSRKPLPVQQVSTVLVARIDPVDLLAGTAEAATPNHRLVAVRRLAPLPGLVIGDHAEAPAREEGETLRAWSELHQVILTACGGLKVAADNRGG